ncbi:MAG: ABC transporter permease [Nanoarchaeota archaeon]
MIEDYFFLATNNLKRRKVRSWLTMIGIFISIATIFILISLSLGLQNAVTEQFRQLGTDKFFVSAGGNNGPPGTDTGAHFTLDDVEQIGKVPGVKKVTYMVVGNAKLEFNNEVRFNIVIGIDLETADLYFESGGFKVKDGRALMVGDEADVGLGYDYSYSKAFTVPVKVGDSIKINDKRFKVRGIMARIGNPADDKNIYMPDSVARDLFNISDDRVDYVTVQVSPGADVKDVALKVEKRLRQYRGVTEKNQDFNIMTPEEILKSFGSILSIVTGFLLGIAGISLVVGAVGIANTMYTSVVERTREIGVMKAIGARNSSILTIFIIEAGMIGLVGGAIGVVLGIFLAKSLEFIAVNFLGTNLLAAAIPWWLIVSCLLFSFLIGAISGAFPAMRAAKIVTVKALRYE